MGVVTSLREGGEELFTFFRSPKAHMNRRAFIATATAILVAPLTADAQQPAKVPRIGFLGNSTAALEANLVGPFREGLRDLGYVEGRNILIEYRWAEGQYERFPALIAELIALKVDVIVTAGTPASLAVKKATTSIPLVMVAVGDPVGSGLVASLARPGGHYQTGHHHDPRDVRQKRSAHGRSRGGQRDRGPAVQADKPRHHAERRDRRGAKAILTGKYGRKK